MKCTMQQLQPLALAHSAYALANILNSMGALPSSFKSREILAGFEFTTDGDYFLDQLPESVESERRVKVFWNHIKWRAAAGYTADGQVMYTMHTDPGHGWLEVSMAELQRLKIADQISGYSYMDSDGKLAYLEEDEDLSRFSNAKKRAGEFFSPYCFVVFYDDRPFIRSKPHYHYTPAP